MNLPNILTFSRIGLTVLFMLALYHPGVGMKVLAIGFFVLAMLTDYWDGDIARKRGQITPFGKLMDPIADKILVLAAFLAFVEMRLVQAWMVVAIIARDLLITGVRLAAAQYQSRIEARPSGKHKTVLQFAAILGVLIYLAVRETGVFSPDGEETVLTVIYGGMLLVVAVTLWSGLRFLLRNRVVIRPGS